MRSLITVPSWLVIALAATACSADNNLDLAALDDGSPPEVYLQASGYLATVQVDSFSTWGELVVTPGETVQLTAEALDAGGIRTLSLTCPDSPQVDALLRDDSDDGDLNPATGASDVADTDVVAWASLVVPEGAPDSGFRIVASAEDLSGVTSLPVTLHFAVQVSDGGEATSDAD